MCKVYAKYEMAIISIASIHKQYWREMFQCKMFCDRRSET